MALMATTCHMCTVALAALANPKIHHCKSDQVITRLSNVVEHAAGK